MDFNLIRNKLNKIKSLFEIYTIFIFALALFGWLFSYEIFSSIIIIFGILALLICKDFKYLIPVILGIIFSYSTGFNINEFPISLIVLGSILVLLCILNTSYSLKKFHFDKYHACYLIITILGLIALLWNHNIPVGNEILYLVHLTWLLYLFVYFVFKININKNIFNDVLMVLTYLGILISIETCIVYFQNPDIEASIVLMLGWGIVNEAGIMLCFIMPAIFFKIINSKNIKIITIELGKLAIILIGIIFTTSRGAYLFGGLEFVLLSLVAILFSKKKKFVRYSFLSLFALGIISVFFVLGIDKIISIVQNTFVNGFNSTGRVDLWKRGIDIYSTNIFTMLFGNGMVAEFYEGLSKPTESGWDIVYIVYHSTIIESLVSFGLIGSIALFALIYFKYDDLKSLSKINMIIMFVGYLCVDLYGLIDNTYGMYYYMIPLIILMVSINSIPYKDPKYLF
ncbi:MAG: O-antigen ligase family protein [Anaeroplasma sp.]